MTQRKRPQPPETAHPSGSPSALKGGRTEAAGDDGMSALGMEVVVPVVVVDAAIRRLADIGLMLAAEAARAEGESVSRLQCAVDALDEVAQCMRKALFEALRVDGPAPSSLATSHRAVPSAAPDAVPLEEILEGLRCYGDQLMIISHGAVLHGSQVMGLLEAAHSAYRAVLALEHARQLGEIAPILPLRRPVTPPAE